MSAVATITMNVIGIRSCAPPPIPAWLRPSANVDEVAAATIPRGAIQAMNARSRQSSDEPNVDSATASGRPTNTSTATKAMLTHPISAIWSGVTRAERMMNKIPIRNVVSVPIRSRHERTSFARWIATPCGSVPPGAG